uniref:Uncharacterized protein n=1 Tax=Meloidogyne floridensis TaxID=298350 RepID=A0A915NN21_9BILA
MNPQNPSLPFAEEGINMVQNALRQNQSQASKEELIRIMTGRIKKREEEIAQKEEEIEKYKACIQKLIGAQGIFKTLEEPD